MSVAALAAQKRGQATVDKRAGQRARAAASG
jgi:hypothetical protein